MDTDGPASVRSVRPAAPGPPLSGASRGDGGEVDDVGWTFETPPGEVELVDAWEELRGTRPLLVWCEGEVSPQRLAEHLRVVDPKGRPVRVEVEVADPDPEDDREEGWSMLAVHPRATWPEASELRVELGAGFRADDGVLPLQAPMAWTLETFTPFRLEGVACEGGRRGTCPLEPVTLTFTRSPDTTEGIRMRPEPPGFSAASLGGGEVVLDGEFEAGRRYTVVVPADLRDWDEEPLQGTRTTKVRFSDVVAPRGGQAAPVEHPGDLREGRGRAGGRPGPPGPDGPGPDRGAERRGGGRVPAARSRGRAVAVARGGASRRRWS